MTWFGSAAALKPGIERRDITAMISPQFEGWIPVREVVTLSAVGGSRFSKRHLTEEYTDAIG